jgi:hypothetical protein
MASAVVVLVQLEDDENPEEPIRDVGRLAFRISFGSRRGPKPMHGRGQFRPLAKARTLATGSGRRDASRRQLLPVRCCLATAPAKRRARREAGEIGIVTPDDESFPEADRCRPASAALSEAAAVEAAGGENSNSNSNRNSRNGRSVVDIQKFTVRSSFPAARLPLSCRLHCP